MERRMRKGRSRRLRVVWNVLQISILLVLAVGLGGVAAMLYSVSRMLPPGDEIGTFLPHEATLIYSADGQLIARIYEENREAIQITDIPKILQDATVAIEDSRFYTHAGVDLKGIARALWVNLRGGRLSQGGSTLTQQLATSIYLTRQRTVSRKLQEMLLARELERRKSKEEILELYLNQVYYGSGAYGVKAAARAYFGKKPADLTLAEAALVAGLPQRPSAYSPHENKQAAINRRDVVINRMAELGYITLEQARQAKSEQPNIVNVHTASARLKKAPHFVDYVVKQLEAMPAIGHEKIYQEGLKVYTTLNMAIQGTAERSLRERYDEERSHGKHISEGCVVVLDPHTGYIKAMVGSVDYYRSQFNRVVQGVGLQPGSAFKPFVYTAAIDSGKFTPNSYLQDTPLSFPDGWKPRNYDGRYRGRVTLRQAVEQSINMPAIRTIQAVGVDKVIRYAHRMGIKRPLGRDLSLALGTSTVYPLEIASAYGVFATGGRHAEPISIAKVVGREDQVLVDNRPQVTTVIPPETANTMADILRGVVTRGTGRRAAVIDGAAGKTGTTQNVKDAWFVGFTKDLVAAVWLGNEDERASMGSHVYGGTVCAPIWVDVMKTALPIIARAKQRDGGSVHVAQAAEERERRSTAEERRRLRREIDRDTTVYRNICLESGQLATSGCRRSRVGFARGSEPTAACPIHSSYTDQAGGLVSPDAAPESGGETGAGSESGGTATPGRAGEDTPRPSEPKAQKVSICIQSGKRANEYCPEVEHRSMPEAQVPGTCTSHGPAAGHDGGTN